MSWERYRTVAATADAWIVEPILANDRMRTASRSVLLLGLAILFGYSGFAAWRVLDSLRTISLADATSALRFVSVRDAILCLVAWRAGKELLHALPRRRV